MNNGLRFVKADVRGKVFVEYIPAEYAWRPVIAPGYIFIHCLWVSGRFQGQGYASQLLQYCLEDAKGTAGVVAISSSKTWLTDTTFYKKHGFEKCDTAPPYFDMVVKRFDSSAPLPHFPKAAQQLQSKQKGLLFYYTDQCPFTTLYVQEMARAAQDREISVKIKKIDRPEEAQQLPFAFATFGVFLDGVFLTHKLMSEASFGKLLDQKV